MFVRAIDIEDLSAWGDLRGFLQNLGRSLKQTVFPVCIFQTWSRRKGVKLNTFQNDLCYFNDQRQIKV